MLTFYSITSEIGPSLVIGNLLIFTFAWAWSPQNIILKMTLTHLKVLCLCLRFSQRHFLQRIHWMEQTIRAIGELVLALLGNRNPNFLHL